MKSKVSEKKVSRTEKIGKLKTKSFLGDDHFADFAKEAKSMFKDDLIIPTGEDDALLEVSGWIPMPDEVQHAMDTPGVPCGLVIQAYGLPDSGKTTFANTALVNTQQDGGVAVLFKTEDKYSLKRAAGMGIDVKRMLIFRPRTIEAVGDRVQDLIELIHKKGWEDRKVTIVWDSLAATPCAAELNEKRTSFSMDAAKAIRGMLRKVTGLIKETNIAFVIINQVYDNTNTFGSKTTPYGGKGAIYHSAIILSFAQINRIRPTGKKDGDFCGINCKIEVKKNHLGQPFKTAEIPIDWRGFVFDRSPEYAPAYLKPKVADPEFDVEDDEETPKVKAAIAKAKVKARKEEEDEDDSDNKVRPAKKKRAASKIEPELKA
jgi:RecA/RadA recombinase